MDKIDNDVLLTTITKLKNTVRALSVNVCLKSEHWLCRCYKLLFLILCLLFIRNKFLVLLRKSFLCNIHCDSIVIISYNKHVTLICALYFLNKLSITL